MDLEEFCKHSEKMLDYIVDYVESFSNGGLVTSYVQPGYLKPLISETAPLKGEPFEEIMKDVDKYIMPGLTHWQHPGFHAYFPTLSSYSSILGEMLSEVFSCMGLNFNICPSGYELEAIVCDWYGKMIGLPNSFLRYSSEGSKGGGYLEGTVTECMFMCIINARQKFVRRSSQTRFSLSKPMVVASLVAYCSRECPSYVQKTAIMSLINLRILDTDENHCLRGETLAAAVRADKQRGLIPFFVHICFGNPVGACDPVEEIGLVCSRFGLWLNVDASYGGNALVCPEYQVYFKGIEHASSVICSPSKWLPVHLDCSAVFAKDLKAVTDYMIVDRTTFGFGPSEEDWTFQSNDSYRIFKLWVVLRSYGIEGLQSLIWNHVRLAKLFEECIQADDRFQVLSCNLGIVCFRLKGSDLINEVLLKKINTSGKLLLNSYNLKGTFVLRFVACSESLRDYHILETWNFIANLASEVLTMKDSELKLQQPTDSYDYSVP